MNHKVFLYIMLNLLKESRYFNGVTFKGAFTIPMWKLELIHDHYIKTGERVIDSYCETIYLTWSYDVPDFFLNKYELFIHKENLERINELNLLSVGEYEKAKQAILIAKRNLKIYDDRLLNNKRQNAQKFLGKRKIREEVFELHGKSCLCCGSVENISLDHVIPIHLKGLNEIGNLQPLCKSCNSKKGIKVIDYRQ